LIKVNKILNLVAYFPGVLGYMDNFAKELKNRRISEWKEKYIPYEEFSKQIKQNSPVISSLIASKENIYSFLAIRELGEEILELPEEKEFCENFEERILVVEKFYKETINQKISEFHQLVGTLIKVGLIKSYEPLKQNQIRIDKLFRNLNQSYVSKTSFVPKERKFPLKNLYPAIQSDLERAEKNNSPLDSTHARINEGNKLVDLNIPSVLIRTGEEQPTHLSLNKLKSAFSDLHLALIFLKRFVEDNKKIIKKLLKLHHREIGYLLIENKEEEFYEKVKKYQFIKFEKLKLLIDETEDVYTEAFWKGNKIEALKDLKPPSTKMVRSSSIFRLGIVLGFILPVLVAIFYFNLDVPLDIYPRFINVITAYRMIGIGIVLLWFWGADMYLWSKHQINYPFIIEFNRRTSAHVSTVLEFASYLSLIWICSLFVYLITFQNFEDLLWLRKIPFQVYPLFLIFMVFVMTLIFQVKARFWLFKVFIRIFATPFVKPHFHDIFVAEQVLSIAISLNDFASTLCFFSYDAWTDTYHCTRVIKYITPLVVAIPITWRFLQCLRQYYDSSHKKYLVNAAKYFLLYLVILFSKLNEEFGGEAFNLLWIFSIIIVSICTFFWDITQDWGLDLFHFKLNCGKDRVLPRPVYIVALVVNLFLRFAWTLTINPVNIQFHPMVFDTMLGLLETFRRAMWNFFRIEHEHLKNTAQLRAVTNLDEEIVQFVNLDQEENYSDLSSPALYEDTGFGRKRVN